MKQEQQLTEAMPTTANARDCLIIRFCFATCFNVKLLIRQNLLASNMIFINKIHLIKILQSNVKHKMKQILL